MRICAPIDPRGQKRVAGGFAQASATTSPIAAMDRRHIRAHRLSQNAGGDCEQARTHHLGVAGQGRRL